MIIRDTDKKFELHEDLFKTIINKNCNIYQVNLADKTIMYEFAKEMYFVQRALGNKTTKEKALTRSLKSPVIMASGISMIFLPPDPDELCGRIKLLLQEKKAGKNSSIIDEEVIAIADKL